MARFLIALALAGCTGADTDSGRPDTELSTYEDFVAAHSRIYCASVETCEYLDERSYADRAACITAVSDLLLAATCDAYSQPTAERCIREDQRMATACDEFPGGQPSPSCRDVCTAPTAP